MSRHVLSVCIFCFICATHSPCASHAATRHENVFRHKDYHDPKNNIQAIEWLHAASREKPKYTSSIGKAHDDNKANELVHPSLKNNKVKRDNSNDGDGNSDDENNNYIEKIFLLYGNGKEMTVEGFTKFLSDLNLHKTVVKRNDGPETQHRRLDSHSAEKNTSCLDDDRLENLIKTDKSINQTLFYEACPILVYNIINSQCLHAEGGSSMVDNGQEISQEHTNWFVWLCSIIAVIVISACGVLSLAIIPVMQKRFYKPLIQFLVALAVGTLAGDALLHLLPHAMTSGTHHHHYHDEEGEGGSTHHHHHHDNENIQKGCVAMLGLTFFFIMERLILLIGDWRKAKQKHQHSHVTVINDAVDGRQVNNAETQCMDRYNSVPYCYNDIMNNPHTIYESDKTTTSTPLDPSCCDSDNHSCKKSRSPTLERLEGERVTITEETNKMLTTAPEYKHNEDYTVIVREHKNEHHGHSHKHGHVHAAPKNFSSVAWMVIMGDGLHNFTDGMAIGAAFSGSLAGGFSTTVAVFCHELPHELGDFAMLLKAGMTIKQALFYNILSSVLCVFGNVFGLVLGNTEYASSWVFAAAAGMFIYIALVDMIPELSSAHEDEGNLMQAVLHLSGLLAGLGIMALIAFYEHSLMTIFNDAV